MSKVVGRVDDMLVIRGVNLYPSEVEAVVLADPQTGPQYLIVVDARGPLHRLVICCEPSSSNVDSLGLVDRLRDAVRRRIGIGADIRVVEPGALPRTEVGKARRVVRWTEGPAPVPDL
jgi:phenylacetate-CoA ligase